LHTIESSPLSIAERNGCHAAPLPLCPLWLAGLLPVPVPPRPPVPSLPPMPPCPALPPLPPMPVPAGAEALPLSPPPPPALPRAWLLPPLPPLPPVAVPVPPTRAPPASPPWPSRRVHLGGRVLPGSKQEGTKLVDPPLSISTVE